ncbi:unnamed protein product [Polarella glacialis]|uniref:Uncharacterized protein n=1 Tax=Polarella glacialis TaxID=89957 RepID=A0A813FTP1_POLGL|nr:unnamed protein product [Polarella glacialis]
MATPKLMPPLSGSSSSAVVSRRALSSPSKGAVNKKPSIRKTIESMVSTGSQSEYFRPDQTIIIFDWDDTLCPSSWIRANKRVLSFFKPAPNTEKFQRPLRELQAVGEQLLRFAMKLGTVIIVTNAMDPWVETSCRNFLPQLLPLVSQLPVIYARSIYEAQGVDPLRSTARSSSPSSTRVPLPGLYAASGQNRLSSFNTKLAQQRCAEEMSPQKWKEVAFSLEINGFYSRYAHQSWKNVISIGDSIFERDAVRRVVVQRPDQKKKCRTKTLKLFDDPEIEELIAQVKVVQDVLNVMVQYDGDLDIEIDEDDLKLEGGCIVDKLRD